MGLDTVWDGTGTGRTKTDYHWPDVNDFNNIVAKIAELQGHLLNGATADPGSDPVVTKLNDHLNIITKDIIVAVGSSAVASVDLGYDIPAASIVLGAAMNIQSAVTLATATKIGLGVAGTLDKYGLITGGTKNNKSTVAITPTAIASAEDVKIYATDNSSAAAGTIQNGSIRVRLTLLTQTALENA